MTCFFGLNIFPWGISSCLSYDQNVSTELVKKKVILHGLKHKNTTCMPMYKTHIISLKFK